jgi:hypothetical protein
VLAMVALLAIGGLSFSLVQTNSKLNRTRGDLSLQQQISTAADIAAAGTRDHQKALSTQSVSTLIADNKAGEATRLAMASTNIGLINKNTNLNTELENLKKAAKCPTALSSVDFTNNATVSKALVDYLGDVGGSNLFAKWEIIWSNTRAAIHRISGKYLWVYIVTFEDSFGMHDVIYDVGENCFLYKKS